MGNMKKDFKIGEVCMSIDLTICDDVSEHDANYLLDTMTIDILLKRFNSSYYRLNRTDKKVFILTNIIDEFFKIKKRTYENDGPEIIYSIINDINNFFKMLRLSSVKIFEVTQDQSLLYPMYGEEDRYLVYAMEHFPFNYIFSDDPEISRAYPEKSLSRNLIFEFL